jgi:hypothetical protein
MARARNIKPGFYKNEDLAECDVWTRFIFPGLWMMADRNGRLEDRPKRIKAEILPFDAVDVEPLLRELAAHQFIQRYEVGGVRYIQILRFSAHQTPHYSEKESGIPGPSLQEITRDEVAATPRKLPSYVPKEIRESSKSPPENSGNEHGLKRGSQPPDSLNPDSLNPESGLSDSPNPESRKERAPAKAAAPPKAAPETGETWTAYATAFAKRYGTDPVRNAKVNGMLKAVVDRLGATEAPQVAAFYVGHNRALYVSAKHVVDLLLRDCEGLRTEWATNRQVTSTQAMQTDRTQTNANAFAPLLEEARARKVANEA